MSLHIVTPICQHACISIRALTGYKLMLNREVLQVLVILIQFQLSSEYFSRPAKAQVPCRIQTG